MNGFHPKSNDNKLFKNPPVCVRERKRLLLKLKCSKIIRHLMKNGRKSHHLHTF